MFGKTLAAIALVATVGIAGQVLAQDSPENLVGYRQAVMKTLSGHISAIASVVKGETSYGDYVANHARAMDEMGPVMADIWGEGTSMDDVEGSATKAVAWEDPAKLDSLVTAYQEAAAQIAEAAETGDMNQVGAALGALGKSCGDCHKAIRHKDE